MQHALTSKEIKSSDEPSKIIKERFWNSIRVIRESGLIYEAVTLFDVHQDGKNSPQARFTIRINDYFAGATLKVGDPNLGRELDLHAGSNFMFYTNKENERSEPEALWVLLPEERGHIIGIWRPRFRASNSDTGSWIDRETESIHTTLLEIIKNSKES
jgi:hypothetical protein